MSASFVGSLVASTVMCAVLAYRVEVGEPPPAPELDAECVEDETRDAWVHEVFVEGAILHEPCDAHALSWRLYELDGALEKAADDEELRRERARVLIELRRCAPEVPPSGDGCG